MDEDQIEEFPVGRLEGKVAIVTGGAAGIGAACVDLFLQEGARVLIADLRQPSPPALGGAQSDRVRACTLDVRSEESWSQAIDICEKTWGRLDVLVNSAGVSFIGGQMDPETITLEEWRAVHSINVEGVVLGCKHAIEMMKRSGGGSIVNLSSVGALFETSLIFAYGASKAAVSHITKSVALHCAKKDLAIRCNAVLPGPTETGMYWTLTEEQRAENARRIPIGFPGKPIDIAHAVAFLASDEARFITGIQLSADGGLSAANPMRSRG